MNILLICAAGISTANLVSRMKYAAAAKGLDLNISSVGIAAASIAVKDADVILLGPPNDYLLKSIEDFVENKKPVALIDYDVYKSMDGVKALEFALSLKSE